MATDWRKGLPKRCECGGKMVYVRDFGRIFSHCDTCTPVVRAARSTDREGDGGR